MKVYRRAEGTPTVPNAGGRFARAWPICTAGPSCRKPPTAVSQKLAAVDDTRTLQELIAPLCRPVQWQGQRVSAVPAFGEGHEAPPGCPARRIRPAWLRNRDLRSILYPKPADAAAQRRQSAAVTRQIRLLRGHGLIAKVPKTHRYQLTDLGRTAITTLLQAQHANAAQLPQLAA
jgi:hypothetical protein